MYNYIINGGNKLVGNVSISGSKNACLPILAATIISGKKSILHNVPEIEDVGITLKILKQLGCKIEKNKNIVVIDSANINKTEIPSELMKKLRASIILVGAILARFRNVRFSYPGGCDIGKRPIDLHLENFKKIGIKIIENSRYIECKCDKIHSAKLKLKFPSVGATENLILASILGNHEIIIQNIGIEPEIIDLIKFLNQMGAKIAIIKPSTVRIIGVKDLNTVSYNIMPDRIEAGTFLIAGAITGGNIKVINANSNDLKPVINKLTECGCNIYVGNNFIHLISKKNLKSVNIKTMPHPGFPTDLQPIFSSLLTICDGVSVVTENIFENRFKYMKEIEKMGAKVEYIGNKMFLQGIKELHASNLMVTDLRGGAAMVLAALKAKGVSKIYKLKYILRGYEHFDNKLRLLGANITKEKGV